MGRNVWLYRPAIGNRGGEFILLVNSKGSSSCRKYDPSNGVKNSEQHSPGCFYEVAFARILAESKVLPGLPDVKVNDIKKGLPLEYLEELRSQAGLPPAFKERPVAQGSIRTGGMLAGIDEIVDSVLGVKQHKTKKAAIVLSETPPEIDCFALIQRMYQRVVSNWDRSPCRSRELWRWRAMTDISPENMSAEKMLEKAIVNTTQTWVNQIPVASGLLMDYEEGHTCVDLGHRVAPGHFELIELKAGENAETPLRAAFQIVNYGLLYCFARQHRRQLELPPSEIIKATTVYLKVLGPTSIYRGYRLGWLGNALDAGLRQFSHSTFGAEPQIRFGFESFPPEFVWPGSNDQQVRIMLERRKAHDFIRD